MSVTDVEEDDSNTNAADKDAAAAGMSTWVIGIRGVGDKKISLNTAAIDDMPVSKVYKPATGDASLDTVLEMIEDGEIG